MANNEKSGPKARRIAGRLLKMIAGVSGKALLCFDDAATDTDAEDSPCVHNICTVADLKTLAASVLTQSPDNPKKKER